MKVWIVCDNNGRLDGETIILFKTLEAAQKHQEQYKGTFHEEDCWIVDTEGTEVRE